MRGNRRLSDREHEPRSGAKRAGAVHLTWRTLILGMLVGILATAVLPLARSAWAQQVTPAWLSGVPVGGWVQIPNTAISSVQPNPFPPQPFGGYPEGKIRAWIGMAIDQRSCTLWSVANGGHNDYSGNEADAINLMANAPAWVQKAPPSMSVSDGQSYYPDGRPSARHTYYGPVISTIRNRYLIPGGVMYGSSGPTRENMDGFDIVNNVYDPAGTYPSEPIPLFAGGASSVLDPRNDNIYFSSNGSLAKWTQATNTWTMLTSSFPIGAIYQATAWDSKRNLAVFFSNAQYDSQKAVQYSPDAGTTTQRTYSGPNASAPNSPGGDGITYVPSLDAFLVHKGEHGGVVYKIDANTFNVTTFSSTGGSNAPGLADESGCSNCTAHIYNRFLYCGKLGGVVYLSYYSANLWFLRTDAGGGGMPPSAPTTLLVR